MISPVSVVIIVMRLWFIAGANVFGSTLPSVLNRRMASSAIHRAEWAVLQWSPTSADWMSPAVFQEYLRTFRQPETIHAICEDYCATFGVDLPEDMWLARGPLSVTDLADIVRRTPRTGAPTPRLDRSSPVLQGRLERIEHILRGRGQWAELGAACTPGYSISINNSSYLCDTTLA